MHHHYSCNDDGVAVAESIVVAVVPVAVVGRLAVRHQPLHESCRSSRSDPSPTSVHLQGRCDQLLWSCCWSSSDAFWHGSARSTLPSSRRCMADLSKWTACLPLGRNAWVARISLNAEGLTEIRQQKNRGSCEGGLGTIKRLLMLRCPNRQWTLLQEIGERLSIDACVSWIAYNSLLTRESYAALWPTSKLATELLPQLC